MNKFYIIIPATAVVSFAGGGVASYFFFKYKFGEAATEYINKEIERYKNDYARLHKTEEFASPEELAKLKGYYDAAESYSGTPAVEMLDANGDNEVEEPDPEPEPVVVNIFTQSERSDQLKRRENGEPHVIPEEEFNANETGYEQLNLTYFEGDGVLADDQDKPIDDELGTVGPDALSSFGKGTSDNNVVFVRSPQLRVDFEITRMRGKFTEDILGIIEHSDGKRDKTRRFRGFDD